MSLYPATSARVLLAILSTTVVAQAEFDFRTQVQPVLENQCVRCHNAEKTKGGLRLDTKAGFLKGGESGPVVVPGDLEKSELIRRIKLPRGHEDLMPQEAEPLTGPHRNWLVEWVKSGARWPDGVVLKARKREAPGLADFKLIPEKAPASLPEAAKVADTILTRENAAIKGAAPRLAPGVDDTAFLRRVTVDLIGRIPTIDEVTAFENEAQAARREKLVDRLLENPRFSERWTAFFADMLRIRSQAEGGSQLLAYVNRCLADRKPYDEMARELIATNGRAEEDPAAGFALSDAANPMALAGATAQVFLGVRIGCAECHDHPFDDWKQKEFYELAAYFGQTKRIERGKNIKRVFTTEGDETTVKWPPEREQAPKRDGVTPKFPFELVSFKATPQYIGRLETRRKPAPQSTALSKKSLDDLVDAADPKSALKAAELGADVLAEAAAAVHSQGPAASIYRPSELRQKLALLVTDPRNPYFARAFVNRVWAELVGRGFVEPLDNFSAYNEMRHPQTLQFLAQEFTAGGYDLRSLVKTIILTGTYQRGHLAAGATPVEAARAEESFTATRPRRMLGEVLFDSVAAAGHVQDFKWPEGANTREVKRQVRIPLAPSAAVAVAEPEKSNDPTMTAMKPAMGTMAAAPYGLEKGEKLDFEALLKPERVQDSNLAQTDGAASPERLLAQARMDAVMMKKQEDDVEEAARQARNRALRSGAVERFRLETITEMVDDNPKFDTAFRMATPAPPSHFVRVFGQPSREGLGEFRDEAPSLRQELLMLNGKATHEAARVGPLEPIHQLLANQKAKPEKAIEFAYLEILTRRPSAEEVSEGRDLLATAANPEEGLADLRWALLNCHEFRYLP